MRGRLKECVFAVLIAIVLAFFVIGIPYISFKKHENDAEARSIARQAQLELSDVETAETPEIDTIVVPVEDAGTGQEVPVATDPVPDIGWHDDFMPVRSYDFWKDVTGYKTNEESADEVVVQVNSWLTENGYSTEDDFLVGNYSSLEEGTWGVDVEFNSIGLKLFVYYDGYNDEYTVTEQEY